MRDPCAALLHWDSVPRGDIGRVPPDQGLEARLPFRQRSQHPQQLGTPSRRGGDAHARGTGQRGLEHLAHLHLRAVEVSGDRHGRPTAHIGQSPRDQNVRIVPRPRDAAPVPRCEANRGQGQGFLARKLAQGSQGLKRGALFRFRGRWHLARCNGHPDITGQDYGVDPSVSCPNGRPARKELVRPIPGAVLRPARPLTPTPSGCPGLPRRPQRRGQGCWAAHVLHRSAIRVQPRIAAAVRWAAPEEGRAM